MTVAALVLADSTDEAVADAAGRPAVRRIAEVAWAGGAVPIVVIAIDRDTLVASALAGSQAVLAEPAPDATGTAGQIARGFRVATDSVAETDAALVWPAHMTWVDAETVTSLIQAHGLAADILLQPSWQGQPGWPVLLPTSRLDALEAMGTGRTPDELLRDLAAGGLEVNTLDLGDPGTIHGIETALIDLPAFDGPSEPVGRPPPEWGVADADRSEDEPLQGPSLAPYPQAADPDDPI